MHVACSPYFSPLILPTYTITAKFFHTIITAFIKCLLAHVGKGHWCIGTFGIVKAYYGCVEAQGQGTLHFHMLIWLEEGLGPNALRDWLGTDPSFHNKLFNYIKEIISTSAPTPVTPIEDLSTTYHPTTIQHPQKQPNETETTFCHQLADDFHLLVKCCQRHEHSATCYKYDPTATHC